MTDALELRGLSVSFGGHVALREVSLVASPGEVTGLIGPNGAGKTTLFNVVSGLLTPDRGRILLGEADITRVRPHRRARLGLGRTFQRLELFTALSVRANVRVGAKGAESVTEDALDRVGIRHLSEARVDELPTGQARLVELARALATQPTVLLLDEPASGQNETETNGFAALLRRLAGEGLAVVLVEHDMSLVMRVCSVVHVLDFGELLATGTPDEIQHDQRVLDAYLGSAA